MPSGERRGSALAVDLRRAGSFTGYGGVEPSESDRLFVVADDEVIAVRPGPE